MIFFKERVESKELKVLRSLNARMELTLEDKKYYFKLEKGFEGEVYFDSLIRPIQNEFLVLNDLLLKHNNTTFQIDSFFVFQNKLTFYDVKNFEGDYYYNADKIYVKGQRTEILNPINQLGRTSSLLQQLLHSHGYHLPIEGFVVFINPNFMLYEAPLNVPFIFPTQLDQFVKRLNEIPSKLTLKHKKLADLLKSLHISESPFTQVPKYTYENLKKGMMCNHCHLLSIKMVSRAFCMCTNCGITERIDEVVLRSVEELRLLFPDKKITTNLVHDWCRDVTSKKTIKRILDRNFKLVGVHQWAYYVDIEENT